MDELLTAETKNFLSIISESKKIMCSYVSKSIFMDRARVGRIV